MEARWRPGGGQVETRWRNGGQVEARWRPDGGPEARMRLGRDQGRRCLRFTGIPPYMEEMLNPSVFPPYSGISSVFWKFLAIFGAFLTLLTEAGGGNPQFFGLFS